MNELLKREISLLPNKPGCYQMFDKDNNIIYVGKAKNLKNRVSQYFLRPQNGKTFMMVKNVDHFETIITSTEKEALILEMNLIKKHTPRYNILLMDDKHYPYISIAKKNENPYITISRNTNNSKFIYFGPYPSSSYCYETLGVVDKLFRLRKCKTLPTKPCLYYHMHQCFGPCINHISKEEYDEEIKKIESFLNGNNKEIIGNLNNLLNESISNLEFEKAKEYKNLLDAIKNINEKQQVEFMDKIDRDLIGFSTREGYVGIVFFIYRQGKLLSKRKFVYEIIGDLNEFVGNIILQYYANNIIPKEIDVFNKDLKDYIVTFNENLNVIYVTKGKIFDSSSTILDNSKEALDEHFLTARIDDNKLELLEKLGSILNIKTPYYIELFDNSHLNGTNAIGASVAFINGEPYKKLYRKYNIESFNKNDDLSSMKEILTRRYKRLKEENSRYPDLIILDGGLSQLEIGEEVLKELGIHINICSLFKDNNHHTSGLLNENGEKIDIKDDKPLFFFLTRMQDEVHRFAISTHIKKRSKDMFKSIFDDVKGIGKVKKENLIRRYPTLKDLSFATIEELTQIIPKDAAEKLLEKIKKIS